MISTHRAAHCAVTPTRPRLLTSAPPCHASAPPVGRLRFAPVVVREKGRRMREGGRGGEVGWSQFLSERGNAVGAASEGVGESEC